MADGNIRKVRGRAAIKDCVYNPKEFRRNGPGATPFTGTAPRSRRIVLICLLIGILAVAMWYWDGFRAQERVQELSVPASGSFIHYREFPINGPLAPLRIITKPGSGEHYLVKLEDWQTGLPVLAIFIRAGERADVAVPLGSYRIKWVHGRHWYGGAHLFGKRSEVEYVIAPMSFEMADGGRSLVGKVINLAGVVGGNMVTRKSERESF